MNTLGSLRLRALVSTRTAARYVSTNRTQGSQRPVLQGNRHGLCRYNSTAPSNARFTGEVPLEKFLTKQLMDARKTRDTFRTNVLRTVIGEIQTEQKLISSKSGTTPDKLEEAALKNVRKAITKRKATAAEYRSSNLPEAAEHEEKEADFLEALLPKQLSKEEIQSAVEGAYTAVKEEGALSSDGNADVQGAIKLVGEKLEDTHGKGLFSKGDVAGVVMPLLQTDGLVKGGGKKRI